MQDEARKIIREDFLTGGFLMLPSGEERKRAVLYCEEILTFCRSHCVTN